MSRRAAVCCLAAALAGCDEVRPLPGDQVIGHFRFEARRAAIDADAGRWVPPHAPPACPLEPTLTGADVVAFSFEATVSRCSAPGVTEACLVAGHTFLTANGVDRDAGFDGQYLATEPRSEERDFEACDGCPQALLTETLRVAILSASQRAAAGGCDWSTADGGVPVPDGGVVAPGPTPEGFDAVAACGELVEVVTAPASCGCAWPDGGPVDLAAPGCTMAFSLSGVRR